jgi:hypothetical protein
MKTPSLLSFAIATAMLLFLNACRHTHGESTPEEPLSIPPKLQKAFRSDTEFQEFKYDAAGRITQYISQWQYVISDPTQVQRIENTFEYNTAGQLIRVNSNRGFHDYHYKNGMLERIESFSGGRLISTTYLKFTIKGQVSEREEVTPEAHQQPDSPSKTKWVYTYDSKSNCTHVDYFLFLKNQYELYEKTDYSGFDNNYNPLNLVAFYPYVPSALFHINNPTTAVTTSAATGAQNITTFGYQYNEKGIPISKTTTYHNEPNTLHFQY